MMSMLTRLRDYAKLLFTREQKLCLVNNAFTAPDATLQEEVLIVSPTPEEQPSVPEQFCVTGSRNCNHAMRHRMAGCIWRIPDRKSAIGGRKKR